jgi:hypothetical protein
MLELAAASSPTEIYIPQGMKKLRSYHFCSKYRNIRKKQLLSAPIATKKRMELFGK